MENPSRRTPSRKRVRLADVAEAVGVSRSTASLVLRGSPLVADATRKKVLDGCKEFGYVYSRAASSLRAQRTGSIGVVVTTVGNPFFAEVVNGIESQLAETDRTAILGQHSEGRTAQEALLNRLMESGVDGVIWTAAYDTPAESVERLRAAGIAVVMCTRRVAGLDAPYVGADNVTGASSAAEHVISRHNPESIALLGGWPTGSPYLERSAGIRSGLQKVGVDPDAMVTLPSPVSRKEAHTAACQFFASRPTLPVAVFAYNDVVALGVASAARRMGLSVGRDVVLVGFDDIEAAQFEQPSLSTVRVGASMIGEAAADLLVDMVEGSETVSDRIIAASFVARASCGCPHPESDDDVTQELE